VPIDKYIKELEIDKRQIHIINLMRAGLLDLTISFFNSLRVIAPSFIAWVIGVLTSYDI
jgi:hypothetical protein